MFPGASRADARHADGRHRRRADGDRRRDAARAPPGGVRRLAAFAAAGAVAVLGIGVGVAWQAGRSPQTKLRREGDCPAALCRGVIVPSGGARFERLSAAPDELVRLHEGTVAIEVAHLAPGERFRVLIGPDEVEVHGTAFTVTATGDRLRAVTVRTGVVELRRSTGDVRRLEPRQGWLAPAVEAGPPARPPSPRPSRRGRTSRPGSAGGPARPRNAEGAHSDAGEAAFAEGWAALREGDFGRAALSFAGAQDAAAGSQLAEDAGFWRAVALKRGGRSAAARAALASFLEVHARSDRAGEASVMLGWLLLEAGEPAAAAARFRAALDDRVEQVRRGATAGLQAVRAADPSRAD